MGISPHASQLEVNPSFPHNWQWMAVSDMPYRGMSITVLAVAGEHTLYTTFPVQSSWKQISVSESLQGSYKLTSDHPAFWLVIPVAGGNEIVAAANLATHAQLIDRNNGHVVADLSIPAGGLLRQKLR
jgi:hypothetical protein